MRRDNLVKFQGGELELLDRAALQAAAGFDPSYLHLNGGNVATKIDYSILIAANEAKG
jgi:hypothetical protein